MKRSICRKFIDTKLSIYFTPQEIRCMTCFLRGFTYKQVAEAVGIAIGTVSFYACNMRRKLSCRTNKEMINKIKKTDFYWSNFVHDL